MNRFFIQDKHINGSLVQFPGDLAHQITHVLRLVTGDRVEVLDNTGMVYQVQLRVDLNLPAVQGEILQSAREETEAKNTLALCFGLSTREKVEVILQKATEIGVNHFFPFVSSRTLVQSTGLSEHKRSRWERIIREAAEQSHRAKLPELHPPSEFDKCVSYVVKVFDLCLIAWENASPKTDSLRQHIQPGQNQSVGLIVGPEGGFSEKEIQFAISQRCRVISMGNRVLRMETAAIVLPVMVLYQLGEI